MDLAAFVTPPHFLPKPTMPPVFNNVHESVLLKFLIISGHYFGPHLTPKWFDFGQIFTIFELRLLFFSGQTF